MPRDCKRQQAVADFATLLNLAQTLQDNPSAFIVNYGDHTRRTTVARGVTPPGYSDTAGPCYTRRVKGASCLLPGSQEGLKPPNGQRKVFVLGIMVPKRRLFGLNGGPNEPNEPSAHWARWTCKEPVGLPASRPPGLPASRPPGLHFHVESDGPGRWGFMVPGRPDVSPRVLGAQKEGPLASPRKGASSHRASKLGVPSFGGAGPAPWRLARPGLWGGRGTIH